MITRILLIFAVKLIQLALQRKEILFRAPVTLIRILITSLLAR